MATIRQKKLAKAIIENIASPEPLNKQDLVVSVGYSEIVAGKKATEILESKGVKEELRTVYGFDEQTAKNVVADLLIGSDNDMVRLAAAREIFKVEGSYAPEKRMTLNMDVPAPISEEDKALIELLKQNDRNTGTETL